MWKDYFYLNKRERSALWVFTVLIVLTQMAIWTVPAWLPRLTGLLVNKGQPTDSLALPLAEDGFGKTDRPRYDRRETGRWSYGKPCVVRRPFNPNTADSATLVSLGLKPWVAKNIVKYRRKGGQFRKPEDLSKIYGLESSTFRALLPYIRIEPEAAAEGKQAKPSDPKAGDRPRSISESGGTAPEQVASATAIQTKRPDALQTNAGTEASGLLAGNFELNSADTSTLQLLKGVGAVTAARIVRYGSQL
ncbi:MAG: helix-hairpin-helix domain-containing protein, partial [Bacteroidota bacterium]|nr:helix-hairpin-helix domain-containing protein [Bacteroidota bacterium]